MSRCFSAVQASTDPFYMIFYRLRHFDSFLALASAFSFPCSSPKLKYGLFPYGTLLVLRPFAPEPPRVLSKTSFCAGTRLSPALRAPPRPFVCSVAGSPRPPAAVALCMVARLSLPFHFLLPSSPLPELARLHAFEGVERSTLLCVFSPSSLIRPAWFFRIGSIASLHFNNNTLLLSPSL